MQARHRLSLIEQLQQLPDPRVQARCEHDLVDVLVIALCCLLCGGEDFNDMEDFGMAKRKWFRAFPRLRPGIPTHDTFNRVFAALQPEAFLDLFMAWTQSLRSTLSEEIVALDGKALRRATGPGRLAARHRERVERRAIRWCSARWKRPAKPTKLPRCPNSCARWNSPAASSRSMRWAARKRSRARTWRNLRVPCAATGRSRIHCAGCWTCNAVKTKAVRGAGTRRPTWRHCAGWR